MTKFSAKRDLPLRLDTPDEWGELALSNVCALLNDHAHLEKKAASNALDLLPCWPEPDAPPRWVQTMSGVARDEVSHLATVVRLLEKRGGEMTRSHRSSYAQELRLLVRKGEGPRELADRLLVSSLIEARSCERFEILSRTAKDKELAKLYHSLWSSEHGHFRVFLSLAKQVLGEKTTLARWELLLDKEAAIVRGQKPGPTMHSWVC